MEARRARQVSLGSPYFARMVLDDSLPGGGRRQQEVLLGKVAVVEPGLSLCDWRDAPISRLYYEYEEGEEYEEELGGRVREGVLVCRRRVDLQDGVVVEVQRGEELYRLRPDGAYARPGNQRREAGDDHRLPDIVSLITREQFRVIQHAESGVVLLRGRAGSGKTTVALHRIAWLHFQDPARFRPSRMLVVMFNKALQTYISRVLPELGVAGVGVETFHGWAARMFRGGGLGVELRPAPSPALTRLKRHPAMGELLRAAVARLGERSASWVGEQVAPPEAWLGTPGVGLARVRSFRERTGEGSWWPRLRIRLMDHLKDLHGLFDDESFWGPILPRQLHAAARSAQRHHEELAEGVQNGVRAADFEDAALLLRLGQLKAEADPGLACPWRGIYAHVVIDEAQDLSTVELEALIDASDAGRSVTIAGDPAQKILADAQFEGFEALLQRIGGRAEVRLDALAVGHRSTRPIMSLALVALGDRAPSGDPAVLAARDGDPVCWVEGERAFEELLPLLLAWQARNTAGLVAVLCKGRQAADVWARRLEATPLTGVRRATRGDFTFQPGVLVSNVHQVKGLEFDGVVLVDPADFGPNDRHLLHVALTRAADQLWVLAPRGRGLLT